MTPKPDQKPPAGRESPQETPQDKRRLDDARKRTKDRRSVLNNAEKK